MPASIHRLRSLPAVLMFAASPLLAQTADTRFGAWSEAGAANQPGRVLDGLQLDNGNYLQLSADGVVWLTGREDGPIPLNDAAALRPLGTTSAMLYFGGPLPRVVLSADRPAGIHLSANDGFTWYSATGLDASGVDLGLEARPASGQVFHLRQLPQSAGQPAQLALHASADRGESFSRIALLPFYSALDSQPAGNAFYVLRENLLVETNVLGNFLSDVGAVPIDFPPEALRGIGVCAGGVGAVDHVWAFYKVGDGDNAEVRVYRSLDGGRQWQARTSIPGKFPTRIPVQCSRSDPSLAFVAGEGAWRTADGGSSWQPISDVAAHATAPHSNLPAAVHRIRSSRFDERSERLLFATDAGLYESADAGRTVSRLPQTLRNSQYPQLASRSPLGDLVFLAAGEGGYQRMNIIMTTPAFSTRRASGSYRRLALADDGSRVWLAGADGVLLDADPASATASRLYHWTLPDRVRASSDLLLVAMPGDRDRALLGGVNIDGAPGLLELGFDGTTIHWRALDHRFATDAASVALTASPHQQGRLYVADALGRLHRSDDAGRSFSLLAGGAVVGQGVREILVDPTRPDRLLLGGDAGALASVRESLDGGSSFHDYADGLIPTTVNALALSGDGRHLFAASADGPWYHEPATARWRHIGAGQAPDQNYLDVEYVDRIQRARFATAGRGMWQVQLLAPAPAGATLDEPQAAGLPLPLPAAPQFGCPAGFYVAEVDDGPGAGDHPGSFGMELLLDAPGTRELAGGLNFGGLIDAGQPGFAGFSLRTSQTVRLELRAADAQGDPIALQVRVSQRIGTHSNVVHESTPMLSLEQPWQTELLLTPGFYEARVAAPCCSADTAGGAPEAQFYFSMTTPGGPGFEGGAVVGGHHASVAGLISGFASFCLAQPHSITLRTLSAPSYGPVGARDLRLRLRDGEGRTLLLLPATAP